MPVDMNTFADFSTQYAQIFSTGTANVVSEGISAVSGPLTALIVLWLIVQGVLVMRGDVSVRSGVTRIIRVSIVVGLLSSLALFSQYVVGLFQTTLPNWAANSITGGSGVSLTAPQMFDHVWDESMKIAQAANAQLELWDVVDGVELALLQLSIGACLLIAFAVYEIGQIMLGIVIGTGPFVLVGYLFDTTRGIAERWIGKLIGLSLLTLLIAIALEIILQGDENYIDAAAATGALDIQTSLAILLQAALFYALGAVIVVLLPGIAAYIGGGVSFSPASLVSIAYPVARGSSSAARSVSQGWRA
jgi:type IV secretion system protein VirB6